MQCAFLASEIIRFKQHIMDQIKEYEIEGRYDWRGPPYHMIINYTCFVDGYSICLRNIQNWFCIRGNYTLDKYFLSKWSTVCKACIIKVGRSILYSLDQMKVYGIALGIGHVTFLIIAIFTNIIKLFNSPVEATVTNKMKY